MLLKGFPSCGTVRCFEISIDSPVFRARESIENLKPQNTEQCHEKGSL